MSKTTTPRHGQMYLLQTGVEHEATCYCGVKTGKLASRRLAQEAQMMHEAGTPIPAPAKALCFAGLG